jgi:uncharacterized protein (UPF0333 family)
VHFYNRRFYGKAQVAIEYMLIFSLQLIIVALLWSFVIEESGAARFETQASYARNAISKIADASDIVYIQGPPAQMYISPHLPQNLQNVIISGNTIYFEIRYKDIVNNLTAQSISNLTGTLSPVQGIHRILIKAVGNHVEISDG